MNDMEIPKIYKEINSDNYLINCYRNITRTKPIHFFLILIEVLLILFQELEIYLGRFNNYENKNKFLNISYIAKRFDKLHANVKQIIILLHIIIFDGLYYYLKNKSFKRQNIFISIISNILELIHFRLFTLIFSNLLFKLKYTYYLMMLLLSIPHIYIIINNFLYNHLYYFVPPFINYPYDQFSSLFDIILLFIKIFISISENAGNYNLCKFAFLMAIIIQIFFSFFFIYKLFNNSYLFMKNTFLNKSRISLFLINTIIIIFAFLFGDDEIISVLFLIVCLGIFFIVMSYIFMIYNPLHFIKIKKETPLENIFFYLFILSNKNDLEFLIENKLNEHFEGCGLCPLCKKYVKFLENNQIDEEENEERILLIKKRKNKNDTKDNKLLDLFHIFYGGKNKYFELVRKIIINYKNIGKDSFKNNSYYYINLSFLIYSDFKKNNKTLSLNEKILLEVFNEENKLLDNHESQINQILFCNSFINLGNKILTQLKDILNCEQRIQKAKKLLELSISLKEMQSSKYKNNIFNHKQENISNSRNLIMACSIVYEEIFNTSLNNSQIPLRDNIQSLGDIFNNNSNKTDKIISLFLDITNKDCKIIRAGKDLYFYKNCNLFDLFPLVFKEYQINLVLSTILEYFDLNMNDDKKNNNKRSSLVRDARKDSIESKKNNKNIKIKNNNNNKNNNNIKYAETKIIICEIIFSKIYYKLLSMKLTPLFNSNYNSYFILFEGTFLLHKSTLITLQDYEEGNNPRERILAVSDPELEKPEIYSMTLQKYAQWQNEKGFILINISNFNISNKLYCVYSIEPRNKEASNKLKRDNGSIRLTKNEEELDEENKNVFKNSKEKLIDGTSSVISQQTATVYNNGISGIGIRSKKKGNMHEYNSLKKIRKIIYFSIPFILFALLIEFILLRAFRFSLLNELDSYFQFREIYSLYFQLFVTILSFTNIQIDDSNSKSQIEFYSNQFDFDTIDGYFNFSSFVKSQSQLLAEKIMNKRSDLVNIHKNIGDKKYNEIFGQKIKFNRISHNYNQEGKIVLSISYVNIQFHEALLIALNSYKMITNNTSNEPIFLMNSKDSNLILNLYNYSKELTQYQKEIYEIVLNYKNYRDTFNDINDYLFDSLLNVKSKLIELLIYIYLNVDILLMLFICSLLYAYLFYFENILMKILNYINMIMNMKTEKFSFSSFFLKKIENLENILKIYKEPTKCVKNLNNIYSEYQKNITNQNKNNLSEMNKRGYKKYANNENNKNEMDNIPKNQRIVTKKDIKNLHITFKYLIYLFIILFSLIGSYGGMMYMWYRHFKRQRNLYSIFEKDFTLERSIYAVISMYDFMIFENYTLTQLQNILMINKGIYINEDGILLAKFYNDLEIVFDNYRDKKRLKYFYSDIDKNFTCEMIYKEIVNETIDKIEKNSKNLNNIKDKLIKLCEKSGIEESKDIFSAFEYHYQFLKNAILSIKDFSFDGLVEHLNAGFPGHIKIFFNCILIYILDIVNNFPHEIACNKLNDILYRNIIITESIFIGIDIFLIVITFLFYISKIKNFCSQIILLNKIFQIYETQES